MLKTFLAGALVAATVSLVPAPVAVTAAQAMDGPMMHHRMEHRMMRHHMRREMRHRMMRHEMRRDMRHRMHRRMMRDAM